MPEMEPNYKINGPTVKKYKKKIEDIVQEKFPGYTFSITPKIEGMYWSIIIGEFNKELKLYWDFMNVSHMIHIIKILPEMLERGFLNK